MSVKSQLTACRDFLMVGMRAAARGAVKHDQSEKNIRACLDLVEQLVRQSENVKLPEVETTINVVANLRRFSAAQRRGKNAVAEGRNVAAGQDRRLTARQPVRYHKRLL
jgi:hypothetical protein